ncbi:MAG: PKD domain-containing protein [Saprospiraceae bacterium]|nr:PKD domain-containing protein [Saprospiraceae bacterium]
MSIGASYYYQDRKTSLLLKEHFDNHGYWFQTPMLSDDDADGLRFASALQSLFDETWNGAFSEVFLANFTSSDEDNFWSMAYSLFFNRDPQLMFVGNAVNSNYSHMVVATSFEFVGDEVHIQIYDPNYPDNLGLMKYNLIENKFLPYVSAENAQAIEENRYYEFRKIFHIPLSTVVSKKQVDALFLKTGDHSIAKELFPSYEVYANPIDVRFQKIKLQEAFNGEINNLPFDEFFITVEADETADTIRFSEILHYLNPQTKEWDVQDPAESLKLLQPTDNLIGVNIMGERFNNSDMWIGFHYYKIEVQKIWLEADQTEFSVGEEVQFYVRSNGTIPDGARLLWDFGNGNKKTVYNDTLMSYKYSMPGDYTVNVEVYDVVNSRDFGKANIKVQVKEDNYERLDILFVGNKAGDKPFYFDDGHYEGTLSYSNVPAFYALPILNWNGLKFIAEFDYGDATIFYKQKLEGQISADLKQLIALKGYYYWENDQAIYESNVEFKNLPISERNSEQMNIDVSGISAQQHFVNTSAILKTKLPNGNVVPKYSLVNIDWAKARIYAQFTKD